MWFSDLRGMPGVWECAYEFAYQTLVRFRELLVQRRMAPPGHITDLGTKLSRQNSTLGKPCC